MSPGRHLEDLLKKLFVTCTSDQSKTSLRPKFRRFYNVFARSLCWLGNGLREALLSG